MIRKILGKRPKVGLALGSGLAKGMAHVGVIKALQKHDIPIDHIAGTSIGALIGAIYCAKGDADYLETVTSDTNFKKIRHLVDLKLSRFGIIGGDKLTKHLKSIIPVNDFDQLTVPLTIVSADVLSTKQVVLEKGDIFKAIRSSISIPLVFNPVHEDNKLLVDGGLVNPVPIDVLIERGCDYVIAIDLGYRGSKKKEKIGTLGLIMKTFMILQEGIATLRSEKYADKHILIHPDVDDISYIDFSKTEELIRLGGVATNKNIEEIKKACRHKIRHRFKRK